MLIDPPFRSNFLIILKMPHRKADVKSAHPIPYAPSKTNIGIMIADSGNDLFAIPCSACFA